MIEILSLRHKQGRTPRVPLGLQQKQLLRAAAVAHCLLGASLSAGHLYAFFLFVFLCCGSGSFPLAAPASSGCVPPAAKGKSRISRAHETARVTILQCSSWREELKESRSPWLKGDPHLSRCPICSVSYIGTQGELSKDDLCLPHGREFSVNVE